MNQEVVGIAEQFSSFVRNGQEAQKAVDQLTQPSEAFQELSRVMGQPIPWVLERLTWIKTDEDARKACRYVRLNQAAERRKKNSPKLRLTNIMIELLVLREKIDDPDYRHSRSYNVERIAQLQRGMEYELVRLLRLKRQFKNWEKLVQPFTQDAKRQ